MWIGRFPQALILAEMAYEIENNYIDQLEIYKESNFVEPTYLGKKCKMHILESQREIQNYNAVP